MPSISAIVRLRTAFVVGWPGAVGCTIVAPSPPVAIEAGAVTRLAASADDAGESAAPIHAFDASASAPVVVIDAGADGGASDVEDVPFSWNLPPGFPIPAVPDDNPMSSAKVTLGRHLFYDRRLSVTRTASCATCHEQARAFTDGRTVSVGVTQEETPRNSMSLANVGYASTLTWANPLQLTLERQALVPMFGTNPVELGLTAAAELEKRLREVPLYAELFRAAFPDVEEPITTNHVTAALATFERTLISGRSPFDRYLYDKEEGALSAEARHGYQLFNSEKLECFHCHVGFNLTDHVAYADKPFIDRPYHNTGLYNVDGRGAYPEPNTGVFSVTGESRDMGRFKAPSLRNIAVTAPYMHDGSVATLSEVLDHYAAGGRTIESGANSGTGSNSPLKSTLIVGFTLSEDERRDVIAFLESLTDVEFLTDERFSDPWAPLEVPKDAGVP